MKSPTPNGDRLTTLRQRAATFAHIPQAEAAAEESLEVVEFSLSGERYAVEVAYVSEVPLFTNCTPLPCTPEFVVGLVNFRSKIIHVIDLGRFFELPAKGIVDLHHILVVRHGKIELGLVADLITGMRRVPRARLQASLPTLTGIRSEYLIGVTADGLAVLDAARILSDRRQVVQQEVEP